MEISGAVHHRLIFGRSDGGALKRGTTTTTRVRVPARATCGSSGAVFCDEGHRQYYEEGRSKQDKKRAKLIKTLKKDLSELYSLGFGVPSDQCDKITEAAKQLLEQLNQIKVEEEQMKKKKKEEKKAARKMTCKENSSSSSSESSESDCEEAEILKLSDLKTTTTATVTTVPNELSVVPPPLPLLETSSLPESADLALPLIQTVPVGNNLPVKIEVCMGGKCKKAGSMDLLQEFEKQIGGEGAAVVVGCKCMGKCKEGPNVKVSNFSSGTTGTTGMVQGGESVRALKDQLCIGVGLDDVGPIVAHFFGEEEESDAGSMVLTQISS